jgi:DHA1 family bicyclomycin/chloramphenicol resistance-like MFS transporter
MSPGLIVLLLSLLLGLQPVTTDLYLPALPALTEGFGASMAQAQLTLTALLLAVRPVPAGLGAAVGPLRPPPGAAVGHGGLRGRLGGQRAGRVDGPADRLAHRAGRGDGRRRDGRARGGARPVQPVDAARAMSKGLSGLGVIACASAPLGGLLSDLFGWRATLLGVAVFGAATLALIALRFEETVPPANRRALHPASLAKTWGLILRHPTFLAFSALSAASYGGLFTFLATSSFVFIKVLGLSKTHYGLLMFSMSLSYIVGTFICRRLLLSLGVRRTVALAGVLTITGGTLMAVLAMVGSTSAWYGPWAIVGPFYLFMLGHGAHQPCGQSGAIGPFPQAAGTASALNGFLMMVAAFAMGGWLGAHMDGTVFPMVYGIWFWSVLITLSAWTLVQRHGHTPRH